MVKNKKQHYIPQCYLKSWCDAECPKEYAPYVWIFSKDGSAVKKKAPENIFYENDMYTVLLGNGLRDLALEHGLGQLETMFSDMRERVVQRGSAISSEGKGIMCAFTAAMHSRTKAQRDFQRMQWQDILKTMEALKEQVESATPEEKRRMMTSASISKGPSLGYNDVKHLASNPMQALLPSLISIEAPMLCKLDLAIFTTEDEIGFITSDNPCVWFDPEAHKRPPMFRTPALAFKTIEITLPLSPNAVLFLNRQGYNGYIEATKKIIDEINRRTRALSDEYFVVSKNFKDDTWFT